MLVLAGRLSSQGFDLFAAFYRSGALVFGGGHVVLPLLREAFVTPGWISDDAFLAGYGAAQAVPGPLFTFAAYLGAVVTPDRTGLRGRRRADRHFPAGHADPDRDAAVLGCVPQPRRSAQAAMRGVNAAVVGLLGAALYNPVWTSSVKTPGDFAHRAGRLRAAGRLARAAAGRGYRQRLGGIVLALSWLMAGTAASAPDAACRRNSPRARPRRTNRAQRCIRQRRPSSIEIARN